MKIVILSTGRGLAPEYIEELRASLGLVGSDGLCLVAWQRSRAPLAVDRHVVVGPHLLIGGGRGTDHSVQPRPPSAATAGPAARDGRALGDRVAGDEVVPAREADAESAAAHVAREKHAMALLPVWHPRRVSRAATWRLRRLKQKASIRTRMRRSAQFRRVRNRLSPGASLGFAAGCLRSGKVGAMTRDADLVIALDTASHRGAWILAKKVPGPDVVIGIPAARRLLEQRQLTTGVSSS